MNNIRQLKLYAGCLLGLMFGLPALSHATIITLGDGESKYEIKLQSHNGNTWTYFVREVAGKSLSHWNVGIQSCLDKGAVISSSPTGDDTDGSTAFKGMKWDVGDGFTEGTFSVTLDADYPETMIEAQAKAGTKGNERTGDVMGPGCSNPEPEIAAIASINMPEVCDVIYGVHDKGLNDTHILTIDPNNNYGMTALTLFHNELGTENAIDSDMLTGYDIEAIDIDSDEEFYAASGDDSVNPGHLYYVDLIYREVVDLGSTGFTEVDGISFNLVDNSLWGCAQDAGLFRILRDAEGDLDPATSELVFEASWECEDLTWNNAGTMLYVVINDKSPADSGSDANAPHVILAFDVTTDTITVTEVCRQELDSHTGGREIEGLEGVWNDTLILGYHNSQNQPMIAKIDVNTCQITLTETLYNITPGSPYNDIEGLAVCPFDPPKDPFGNCPPESLNTDWMYVADSFTDHTGLESFEIHGMAIKQDGNTVTVAINANMGLEGESDLSGLPRSIQRKIKDGHVGFSDLVFDFSGKKYAVHFLGNDSSVTELGLYTDITLKDVTKENAGFVKLNDYKDSVENPSLGDIPFSSNYFDWDARWSVPTSIASGTQVDNDNFQPLTAEQLSAKGLDFAAGLEVSNDELGEHIFGFSFTKTDDMEGKFTAYFFTECLNDGLGMVRRLSSCE